MPKRKSPTKLSKSQNKRVTHNLLLRSIVENLDSALDRGDLTEQQHEKSMAWWWGVYPLLIGLSVSEVINILNAAKSKGGLAKQYEKIISSMSWKEKIEFMKIGMEEMQKSLNKKMKELVLIVRLLETTPKLISFIIMVV